MIVLLAQMAEPDVPQPGRGVLGKQAGSLLVAQMSAVAADAILQELRILPHHEHIDIVVCLKHKIVSQADLLANGVGDVPDSYKDDFITDAIIPNNVKVILLSPPVKPFTLSENKSITNWFDVYKQGFHDTSYYNFEDAATSSNRIIKIIKNEAKKLKNDYSKIYIGGFSQGACMALYMGLGTSFNLGGVIVCSGFLFPQLEINEENKDLKIFIGHGTEDNVIGYNIAKNSYERILGYKNEECLEIFNQKINNENISLF